MATDTVVSTTSATATTTATTTIPRSSSSHGGALYYVVEVPRAEYELEQQQLAASQPQPVLPQSRIIIKQNYKWQSTESGWDNPFRPGGDLSREADEIVNMIKGGKPITPTGDHQLENGQTPNDSHGNENGHTVVDGVTKLEASKLQSTQNGTKSPQKLISSPLKNGNDKTNGATTTPSNNATNNNQISNQVIPGPQSVSHVVIDEKKKKKCHCCVIQ